MNKFNPTFVGEFKTSKARTHPILIYKLKSDPSKCYQFTRAREGAYFCQGCRNTQKKEKIKVRSIRVKENVFLADPEAMEHYCNPIESVESTAKQIYR